MTTADKIAMVEQVCDHYKKLDFAFNALHNAVGFADESVLHSAAWRVFDAYVRSVEREISDSSDWLVWFVYDNKCGAKKMRAQVGNRMRIIRSAKDLVAIMEDDK